MSRYPRSKFGFALTSISKKGLLTALSTTTVLGLLVFLVAIYAEGPVAAKRLQNDFDASVAKNPPKNRRQSAGQSLSASTQLSGPRRFRSGDDKSENVSFNHRRAAYSGLLNLAAPTVTASKTDALFADVDGDLQADPGDTLKYTVAISAMGEDATGMTFTDTVDPNSAFVPGSLTATPVGLDKTALPWPR